MYRQDVFAEEDIATLHGLMSEHALASVITLNADGLQASHVPLVLYRDEGEFGTLPRPHCQGQSAMVFAGCKS